MAKSAFADNGFCEVFLRLIYSSPKSTPARTAIRTGTENCLSLFCVNSSKTNPAQSIPSERNECVCISGNPPAITPAT